MECRIRVRGHLDPAWGDRLGGLRVAHEASGCSLLAGPLADQAALHGVLLQLIRLGLPLLALETREAAARGDGGARGGGDRDRTGPTPGGREEMEAALRYLCLCYRDEAALAALSGCDRDILAEEDAFAREELRRRGLHLAAATLHPAAATTVVRVRGGQVDVADGDGAGARERLGAIVLLAARDLNEAIRLAATLPAARTGRVEVRSVEHYADR